MNKKKVLDFKPKRKITRKAKVEKVVDEGTLGELKYKVFTRGVIHISDRKDKLLFKKDCSLFEDLITELDLNSLKEDESKKITGSGDNDTLVFTCVDGDVVISLEKPEFNMITKLKGLLNKGKKNKKGDE